MFDFIFNVLRVSVPEHTICQSRACEILETSYHSYNRAVASTIEIIDGIHWMLRWILLIFGTIFEMGLT